jgi:hypothetical protein
MTGPSSISRPSTSPLTNTDAASSSTSADNKASTTSAAHAGPKADASLAGTLIGGIALAHAHGRHAIAYGVDSGAMTAALTRFVERNAQGGLVIARNDAARMQLAALGVAGLDVVAHPQSASMPPMPMTAVNRRTSKAARMRKRFMSISTGDKRYRYHNRFRTKQLDTIRNAAWGNARMRGGAAASACVRDSCVRFADSGSHAA